MLPPLPTKTQLMIKKGDKLPNITLKQMTADGPGSSVDMLSDGNLEFTQAVDMALDLSGLGLGTRSNRYAMIIDDSVVSWIAVEENAGKAEASTAAAVLAAL